MILIAHQRRAAFTLVELLAALLILSILATISLSTLQHVEVQSRVERTKAVITRLDQLLGEKYESYRTRVVPLRPARGTTPQAAAQTRMQALREIMRIELPDRQGDLDYGVSGTVRVRHLRSAPTLGASYRAKIAALEADTGQTWTDQYESAECLWLIVSMMRHNDRSALDFFTAREIGNVDDDAIPEILDAWGQPITFLRWPAGYLQDPIDTSLPPVITMQTKDGEKAPDPFDPIRLDTRWSAVGGSFKPYALRPLIFSRGPDRESGIIEFDFENMGSTTVKVQLFQYDQNNDPYISLPKCGRQLGEPYASGNAHKDNLTNHYLESR